MNRTGRPSSSGDHHADSVRITSAQTSHSARIRSRQTRYLVSMGVRTLCFVLAVATDGTLRWIFAVAAIVLPYVAVVMANAGGEIDSGGPEPYVDHSRLMLEPGPGDGDGSRDGGRDAAEGNAAGRPEAGGGPRAGDRAPGAGGRETAGQ